MSAEFVSRYGLQLKQIPPIQLSTVTKEYGPRITHACELPLHYDVLLNGSTCRITEHLQFFIHPTGPYDIILPYGWFESILKRKGKWDSQGIHIPFSQGVGVLPVSSSSSLSSPTLNDTYKQLCYMLMEEDELTCLWNTTPGEVEYCCLLQSQASPFTGTMSNSSATPSFNAGLNDPNITQFLCANQDVFVQGLPPLPPRRPGFDVKLTLKEGAQPPKTYFKWPTAEEEAFLRQKVDELLKEGFIVPSTSAFGSHVLFVKKKDGSMRMVVDYRAINKLIVDQASDLPPIQYLLSKIRHRKILSSLDCASGYWQLRLQDRQSMELSSFITPIGRFMFRVLPFGLRVAPGHFSRSLASILGDLLTTDEVFLYMDDIFIGTDSVPRHVQVLNSLFDRLRQHRFYLNSSKCFFFFDQLEWLGHVISPQGIQVTPKKVQAIQQLKAPQTLSQLRSVLGLTNFYRRFCQGYAKVAAILSELLKSKVLIWSPQAQLAFEKLKQLITTAPVLIVPEPTQPFLIQCDASDLALGAVLMQNPTRERLAACRVSVTQVHGYRKALWYL